MTQSVDDHLPEYRVRPRFQIETSYPVDEVAEMIKSALEKEDATCHGSIRHGFATLYLPAEEQHYWSPQLTLTLEETDAGSLLRGLYGPRPAVWTMFVFFYALIGFIILIVGILGLSYLTLDKPAGILWLIPVLVLIFLTLYLVAFFGQKLGHNQMVTLHTFVEESTGLRI